MFTKKSFVALLAFAAPLLVRADVTPTEPAPGASFNAGTTCAVGWDGDANSTTVWKNMAIELMTGDNFDMVHLTSNYCLVISVPPNTQNIICPLPPSILFLFILCYFPFSQPSPRIKTVPSAVVSPSHVPKSHPTPPSTFTNSPALKHPP